MLPQRHFGMYEHHKNRIGKKCVLLNFYNSQFQFQNIPFKELTINRTSNARYKSNGNSVSKNKS